MDQVSKDEALVREPQLAVGKAAWAGKGLVGEKGELRCKHDARAAQQRPLQLPRYLSHCYPDGISASLHCVNVNPV